MQAKLEEEQRKNSILVKPGVKLTKNQKKRLKQKLKKQAEKQKEAELAAAKKKEAAAKAQANGVVANGVVRS